MLHRIAIILLALIGLAACSFTPTQPEQNWSFSGKIGVTTPNDALAGFIEWKQTGNVFDVFVSGPFTVGQTRITGNQANIAITQNGQTTEGINPQALIYEQLGWYFPIENLPYWLKGEASPYSQASIEGEANTEVIHQDGWQVEYLRYDAYYELPSKIRIRQGDWKFLIVVKHWSV